MTDTMALGFRDAGGVMGGRATRHRTVVTLRVLQAGCGALLIASLAALGEAASAIPVDDDAATVETVASVYPAIPTEWERTGPLEIPTIGVVPPGLEKWFDPSADQTFVAPASSPSTDVPERSTEPPPPPPPTPAPPVETSPPVADPPPTTPDAQPTPTLPTDPTTAGTTTEPPTTEPTPPETTTPGTTTPEAPPTTTTPEAPPTTEEPAPTPPPVETNDRGNAVLALGEQLSVYDATGAVAFAVAVDSVAADPVCADPASAPAVNGRLIAVQVRVTTGSDLSAVGGEPAIRASAFRFVAPDGVTLVGAGTPSAESCLLDTAFPSRQLGRDQELTGTVVLDVPATTGTLVFRPRFLTAGAEWAY